MQNNFDLEVKDLERAKWYLRNKDKIKVWAIITLLILNLMIWGFSLYRAINYYQGTNQYLEMIAGLAKNNIPFVQWVELRRAQSLTIVNQFFLTSQGKSDYIALVENPNTTWRLASFDYFFDQGQGVNKISHSFFAPQEKKYLFNLGVENAAEGSELVIDKSDWQRIKPTEQTLLSILSSLKIKEINIAPIETTKAEQRYHQISFVLENQSLYGFWDLNLQVAFYQGNQLIDFQILPVYSLKSGEKRNFSLVWAKDILPTNLDIIPDLNIFDQNNFLRNN